MTETTTDKTVQTAMPTPLTVTDAAAQKIYSLLAEDGDFSLALRIYIEGGGCSGFQYGFMFDDEEKEGDFKIHKTVAENAQITVLIDVMSYQYLVGAEVDYQEDLEGERFIIRNPNASTTCGCGSSFAM